MARITMRKTQETKLSEVFSLYLASAAARGVKDKTLGTYKQHFNIIPETKRNNELLCVPHLITWIYWRGQPQPDWRTLQDLA